MGDLNTWWGYLHVNGEYQVKRYFRQEAIMDAFESPFVSRVAKPFKARDRDDALNKIREIL